MRAKSRIAWTLVMLSIFVTMVAMAWGYPPKSRFLPWVIGIPAIVLTLMELIAEIRAAFKPPPDEAEERGPAFSKLQREVARHTHKELDLEIAQEQLQVVADDRTDKSTSMLRREVIFFSYFIGLVAGVLLFGFWPTIPVFLIIFLRWHEREHWKFTLSLTLAAWLIIYLVFNQVVGVPLHEGFLTTYILDLLFPDS